MTSKFFQNRDCEYFPCHNITDAQTKEFNCLFCYCPLHHRDDCQGIYTLPGNGIKDCFACLLPHLDYDYIIKRLMEK